MVYYNYQDRTDNTWQVNWLSDLLVKAVLITGENCSIYWEQISMVCLSDHEFCEQFDNFLDNLCRSGIGRLL